MKTIFGKTKIKIFREIMNEKINMKMNENDGKMILKNKNNPMRKNWMN